MSKFSTDTLRARLNAENGPAHTNRWEVDLPQISGSTPGGGSVDGGDNKALAELCTAVRIPGKTLVTLDRQLGLEPIKVASGYSFDAFSMTFYLTQTYSARKYFQAWMDLCVNPQPPYTAGFYKDYVKDVTVRQLDKLGSPIYGAKLINAYPLSINEIELNNQAMGSIGELTVTLQYSDYKIV